MTTDLTSSIKKNKLNFFNPQIFATVLLLVAIAMLFASFTSAYIVRKSEGNWFNFDLPTSFFYSTIVILLSSIPLALTLKNKNYNTKSKNILTITTITLGVLFCVLQINGWKELIENNLYFSSKGQFVSVSYDYALSGIHLLHIVGGLLYLLVLYIKMIFKKIKSNKMFVIANIYWHFMGVLWIYLYLFMYLSRN